MGFEVVHDANQAIWCPVINTDTLYVGQVVIAGNEGVAPLAAATGAGDTTAKQIPFGVVIGTNRKTPVFSAAYGAEYITYVAASSATAEDYVMVEGPWAKGDKVAMVKVIPITAQTVLKAPLYTATLGTGLTVGTLSGTPTTLGGTSSAVIAGLDSLGTMFVRSGGLAGSYRVTDDTSTTAITWDGELNAAPLAGDTMVRVNLRPQGLCNMQIGTEGLFVDVNADVSAHYFALDVLRLDLSTAGSEYVEFRFNVVHFDPLRT